MTFDELRAAHPELGLAVYAYEPGGVVTLEIHDGSGVYAFSGATLQEAIEKAFPPAKLVPAELIRPMLRDIGHAIRSVFD